MIPIFYKTGIILSIIFVGFTGIMVTADGESDIIPDWIKNTAQWWSQDKISETEYVASLQYLIDKSIIKVNTPSISSVFATGVTISDEQRAQSFVVHFISEHYDFDETYYTFVQFFNKNEATGQPRGVLNGIPDNPEFILGSLPSSEKYKLYEYIGKTFDPRTQIELLNLEIDISILAGDGTTIHTWEYDECRLFDFVVFLDSDKDDFRWSEGEDKEIREVYAFQCQGIHLTIDS